MNIPEDIMEMAKVFTYNPVGGADATSCAPRLTDIPPHVVVVINNLHEVNDHVSSCSNDIDCKIK